MTVLLETENLTKAFGSMHAVHMLDFKVKEGGLKSIIGPNGAGKTTLFNLISGKLPPTEGRIKFNGEYITSLPPSRISQKGLARSFQLTNIFSNLTVFENVRIAVQQRHKNRSSIFKFASNLKEINMKTKEILDQIRLLEYKDQIASSLSYGDQRHLEIGITLGGEPTLLLLDEPTSGMSSLETQSTIKLIEKLLKNLTVILIEHKMDVVMTVSDTIMVMHYGEKIAEGTPTEIQKDQKVREAYLGGL